jgi:hypothetical protein
MLFTMATTRERQGYLANDNSVAFEYILLFKILKNGGFFFNAFSGYFKFMFGNQNVDGSVPQWSMNQMVQLPQVPTQPQAIPDVTKVPETDEGEHPRRPPNAFILYSQNMRSKVRQENPNLSNTEISRLLGKMWKEVPNEIKIQYKQKAAAMQEAFKREHPNYTYRKARRKRALNELLTKSTTSFGAFPMAGVFPQGGDMSQFAANPMMPFGMQGFGQLGATPGVLQPGTDANATEGATISTLQPGQAQMPFQAMGGMPMGMPMSMNRIGMGQPNQDINMFNMSSFPVQK